MSFFGIILPDPVFVVVAFVVAVTLMTHLTLSLADRHASTSTTFVIDPDVRVWMQLHAIEDGNPVLASPRRSTAGLAIAWATLAALAIVAVVVYAVAMGN